jgi:Domain of unknown function (DUF1883)
LNFTHYDLGHLSEGDVVEASLRDSAANVRLMDISNFSSYRAPGGSIGTSAADSGRSIKDFKFLMKGTGT